MIESPTQDRIAQAMEQAHIERSRAFVAFWAAIFVLPKLPRRHLLSRWA